ncbi:MAG: CotH kinase family protein [Firmicutes bacterium]|nr:CotH kinase family protein [Bacillota bacterium]
MMKLKRVLVWFLALCMVMCLTPVTSFATETAAETPEGQVSEIDAAEPADPSGQDEVLDDTDAESTEEEVIEETGEEPVEGLDSEPVLAAAAVAPTAMWVEPSDESGIPAQIDLFITNTSGTTYTGQLFLPGNVSLENCFLSWDGDALATVNGTDYPSGECPIPESDAETTYTFKNGSTTIATFKITKYQGSDNNGVQRVFIDIDESGENPTIKQMDDDENHEVTCTGRININGTWYDMPKIKGRGNATWSGAKDKKPYNVTLDSKIIFPGVSSDSTKKWSFLAEITDHSLLCNRAGYHLANEMGIGQDTTSADVWMNGEYQGCYTITPKTDSFVSKDGFMIEQDNYLEPAVADGGDPQFQLTGMKEDSGWSSCYNRITVKKIGDNLLNNNDSPENMTAVANGTLKPWLQDAWDAIRSDTGYNSKNKYYTDYIDIKSFAQMYLIHEYVKSYDVCAGSILFHRNGMNDTDKLIAGPAWDLDNALGSTCRNDKLGKADDRRNGDRRSAQGDFIQNVTEYKTSIYKTISKHEDFMDEVSRQYNKHRSAFDSLAGDTQQMIDEIEASAKMNHIKVQDLSGTYVNVHKYSSAQSFGNNTVYAQTYKATTNSKSDWQNYADNLKTYITVRSLWFQNNYYDPDYVDPETCEHAYKAVIVEPTCTADGLATYTCPICKDSYTEPLPRVAHDYQNGVCSVCGEELLNVSIVCDEGASVTVYETQELDSPHHDNADSANPRDADTGLIDCSGAGQVNFLVNLQPCRELVSVTAEPATSYNKLKAQAITDVPNSYRITKVTGDFTITVTTKAAHTEEVLPAVDPTCTETGLTAGKKCSVCDEILEAQEEVPKLGHDWDEGTVTKESTCTEAGVKTFKCSRCDETKTEAIDATGHKEEVLPAKEPTCTETGLTAGKKCSVCGEILEAQEEVPKLGHDWDEGTVTKEPSCTEAGVKAFKCSRCDETRTEAIDATGHKEEVLPAVAPTCTETGLTAGKKCSVCGEILVAQEEVAKLGHDWDEGTVTKEPTCTEAGVKTFKCSRCDETRTEAIDATGHIEEVLPAKDPTCTETGLTAGKKCSVCGEILVAQEEVPKLGHDWDEGTVTKEPTCTEAGVKTFKCSRCDETRTEAIEKLGHKWTFVDFTWKEAEDGYTVAANYKCERNEEHTTTVAAEISKSSTDASCTQAGTVIYTATIAKADSLDGTAQSDAKTITGEALGHDWDEGTVTKDPSCTEAGVKTFKCSRCDETMTEAIDATGHTEEVLPAKDPTCTETGLTAGKKCSVCGEILKAQEEIPALGHTEEVLPAKDPTCTETGLTAGKKCSVCGEILEAQKEIPSTDHQWNTTYTVDKAATETADGSKSIHCSVCNEIKPGSEVVIPKLQPAQQKAADGTPTGKGASAEVAEKAIINATSEEGPAGTKYGLLKLKSTKQTKTSLTISWSKVANAKKYVIYGNKCGKAYKMKKLATVTGSAKAFSKIAGASVKKGTYYKLIVVAIDKNNRVVSTSKVIHVGTKGGKAGNQKKVTVKKSILKKAKNLKKGKSLSLKAKAVKASGAKVKTHRGVSYESTNKKIATVSSKGVVKARAKGTCYVYAYAQDGVFKKIKVVVK